MSVNSKMTALADEIRVLSGTTEAMGLDAMEAHVGEANDEVASQVELLAQAVAALQGKAGGSAESGGSIETCAVKLNTINPAPPGMPSPGLGGTIYYLDPDFTLHQTSAEAVIYVPKNTIVIVDTNGTGSSSSPVGSLICSETGAMYAYLITGDIAIFA